MSERPSSSTTTSPAPEDSSPGASGPDAQPQGAAPPGADTRSDPRPGAPPRPATAPPEADGLEVAALIQDESWTAALASADDTARRACQAAWAELPVTARPHAGGGAEASVVEVSVVLADDATVQALNRDYRGRDTSTNVLSFANLDDAGAPGTPDGEPVLLGDIVLARETVLAEARAQAKTPGDHLSHLCVHGLLHLLGYDHLADAEAETMEALERRVLARLGIADPYAQDPDAQDPYAQDPYAQTRVDAHPVDAPAGGRS